MEKSVVVPIQLSASAASASAAVVIQSLYPDSRAHNIWTKLTVNI